MSDKAPEGPSDGGRRGGGVPRRWILMVGGPLVILAALAWYLLSLGRFQTTDNAFVQVAKTPVAPSISGRVVEIFVRENQPVKKGQVLFRLDPRDAQASLSAAEAQLANAEQMVAQQRAAYGREQANVAAARESLSYAEAEATRQAGLAAAGAGSVQVADQARHTARLAREQLKAAEQSAAAALAALGGDPAAGSRAAVVLQARAQLERARLNASYTEVVAPSDGVVARVDQLPVGAYLNASQAAFWLLAGRPWVEANFKEDQIARMRVGQPVEIDIEAYPQDKLKGRVASFAPGTGQAFSALPAQNATGNWVKVTQRLPVRIEFAEPPPDMAARAGLSATVKVNVQSNRDDR
ncbi:MAG: HlyD family secretion protein [Phenylobacterium sp.]|uniref:HlyD family secretion protein n=2 Tax=Phenylobacterium sp. TaxID=1871053 RepID=UPI0025EF025E|nr:HlyD family secretion protein [Phenylobacterium sp.]MCA6231503.1 HlyD family secretion protein [Phenylobacterium sp.]MCA6235691.1 HlyD family secretion protein [Phenylobacterium sp.]MCA6248223.1 HlyD family secretion protein [Phenylobacterium sp.]MCA6269062.1 HlyD family secretion protein [Phenylobacterium sp.]MCA6308716.1 HlyD family secretion protein [Phenylobacterium sp.]